MRLTSKIVTAIVLLLGAAGFVVIYEGMLEWDEAYGARLTANGRDSQSREALLIDVASDRADSFKVTPAGLKALDLQTVAVERAPRPEPLRLPGSLLLDPNRLVRVHARFSGELVSLGQVPVDAASPTGSSVEQRSLRYGDRVTKGQLLGVVWCKDLGEKKSELVDALSHAKIDHNVWDRLAHVEKGAVPQRTIDDAQLAYESDLVAVAKAERTLRSWRLTESEINEVHNEAERIGKLETNDPQADRTWAETEVRSPINGIIVEKNFNVGDIMDPTQDLFKIADLTFLQVLASAYEEDVGRRQNARQRTPPNL
jgi:membrane fusion protein, heavy metal efflux system